MKPTHTAIYGIFDPREACHPMYVGKGLIGRATHHWRRFLNHGTAVNGRLRRFLEELRSQGLEPVIMFLEENVPLDAWEDREKYWIAVMREYNPDLTNVLDGGNQCPIESCRIGGRNGSREAKSRNARIVQERYGGTLAQREWSSRGGRNGNRNGKGRGGRNGSHASKSRAGKIGGRNCPRESKTRGGYIGSHLFWHHARGLMNPKCKLCQQEAIALAHRLQPLDVVEFIDVLLTPGFRTKIIGLAA